MKNFAKTILAITIFFNAFSLFSYTGEVVKTIPAPSKYCTGLTIMNNQLWVADRKEDKLYCLDMASGAVIRKIESPGYWPMGLAWDGKYLWNADIQGRGAISENLDGMIHKLDPENGTILATLRSPSSSPRGIAWDGKYLWCVDNRKDMVIQFSTHDGTTIHSFPSPSSDPQGICFDGKYLWISDRVKDEIYMVDPATGHVLIIADAPGPYIRDLCFDGKHIWAVDYQTDRIYQVKIRDKDLFHKTAPRTQRVILTHQVKNFGPGTLKTLDTHIAIPRNRPNQEIMGIQFSKSFSKKENDQWGQTTARFSFKNLESGRTALSEMTVTFKSWDVRYFIYPEKVGHLADIPENIRKRYLGDNEKYQITHPLVRETIARVLGNEKNPYWIVRKLHQFLIGHLYYKMDGAWDTAPTVLRNGHGSCSEYSFVFISLCRAAGIPTRYVGSTWIRNDEANMDNVFHRWIEVYLPGYGWVPTDPTHGDRKSPRDQAYPIGLCRNAALVTTQSGGGSTSMGWTYNFNETYVTDPKTNLNIENFADWEPVNE